MRRIAKNQGKDSCKWYYGLTNQSVLDNIIKTLNGEINVIAAFDWSSTKECHDYWSGFNDNPHEQGRLRLMEMVEELAIPFKPYKKSDWM